MIGFKGGDRKDFKRSGGGIGNRDLSGKVRQDRSNRGGVAPEGSGKKSKKKTRQRPGQQKRIQAKTQAPAATTSGE